MKRQVEFGAARRFCLKLGFIDARVDYFTPGPSISSFAALYFLKADVLFVVIFGGLCGLAKYRLIG
jgi:hypothetical protein